MFQVLNVDGPNLTTDRGCIQIVPFQYADGGRSCPVSNEDWKAMRTLFIAAPDLLAACEKILAVARRHTDGSARLDAAYLDDLRAAIARAKGE